MDASDTQYSVSIRQTGERRLDRRLPGLVGLHHASLDLLVAHKHHDVPGAQTQEGGNKPAEGGAVIHGLSSSS